tara:strand:+ start:3114 stop:5300 length:2187 start_codon:yes stop_codon:yes gene_type:complete
MMAHPTGMPDNSRAFLGITQVSVSPGWKTNKDYVAEVTVSVSYGTTSRSAAKMKEIIRYLDYYDEFYDLANLAQKNLMNGEVLDDESKQLICEYENKLEILDRALRSLPDEYYEIYEAMGENTPIAEFAKLFDEIELRDKIDRVQGALPHEYEVPPLIYSAFPLAKSQVLDQSHSFRGMKEMAWTLQMQAIQAGNKAAAKSYGRFLKMVEQDVATKNALPVVVPSSNGNFISYRFDPSLHALENPSDRESGSAKLLNAISIPALVVIVCHENDLDKFKTVRLHSSTRWIPTNEKVLRVIPRPFRRAQAERTIGNVFQLDQVRGELFDIQHEIMDELGRKQQYRIIHSYQGTYGTLLSRVKELSQKVGTSVLDVPLPDQARSSVRISPGYLPVAQLDKDNFFTVSGKDLGSYRSGVKGFLGGQELVLIEVETIDTLLFKLPARSVESGQAPLQPGVYDFVLITEKGVRKAPASVSIGVRVPGTHASALDVASAGGTIMFKGVDKYVLARTRAEVAGYAAREKAFGDKIKELDGEITALDDGDDNHPGITALQKKVDENKATDDEKRKLASLMATKKKLESTRKTQEEKLDIVVKDKSLYHEDESVAYEEFKIARVGNWNGRTEVKLAITPNSSNGPSLASSSGDTNANFKIVHKVDPADTSKDVYLRAGSNTLTFENDQQVPKVILIECQKRQKESMSVRLQLVKEEGTARVDGRSVEFTVPKDELAED